MSTPEIEIKVPKPGESISEVMIGEWYVQEGQYVAADRNLVALESDKATFDVPAPRGYPDANTEEGGRVGSGGGSHWLPAAC